MLNLYIFYTYICFTSITKPANKLCTRTPEWCNCLSVGPYHWYFTGGAAVVSSQKSKERELALLPLGGPLFPTTSVC